MNTQVGKIHLKGKGELYILQGYCFKSREIDDTNLWLKEMPMSSWGLVKEPKY